MFAFLNSSFPQQYPVSALLLSLAVFPKMRSSLCFVLGLSSLAAAACPYMDGGAAIEKRGLEKRAVEKRDATDGDFFDEFTLDDSDAFLTSDVGGPFSDQNTLSAGDRGPSLLEDFIFRQKITHFDHERVSMFVHRLMVRNIFANQGLCLGT